MKSTLSCGVTLSDYRGTGHQYIYCDELSLFGVVPWVLNKVLNWKKPFIIFCKPGFCLVSWRQYLGKWQRSLLSLLRPELLNCWCFTFLQFPDTKYWSMLIRYFYALILKRDIFNYLPINRLKYTWTKHLYARLYGALFYEPCRCVESVPVISSVKRSLRRRAWNSLIV